MFIRYPSLSESLTAPTQPLRFQPREPGDEEDEAIARLLQSATPGNEWGFLTLLGAVLSANAGYVLKEQIGQHPSILLLSPESGTGKSSAVDIALHSLFGVSSKYKPQVHEATLKV